MHSGSSASPAAPRRPRRSRRSGPASPPCYSVDGFLFKDLNKNGRLDAYEDWRRPVEERVSDLVSQMTLEEKAGLMVGPSLEMGPGGSLSEQAIYRSNPFTGGSPQLYSPATSEAIRRRHVRQFINRSNADPRTMATWSNAVQAVAEGSRLGIAAFFVTNPRNHLSGAAQFGVNETAGTLSQWPGTLGLAATRDPAREGEERHAHRPPSARARTR